MPRTATARKPQSAKGSAWGAIHKAAAPRTANTTLNTEMAFGLTPQRAKAAALARAQALERAWMGRREGTASISGARVGIRGIGGTMGTNLRTKYYLSAMITVSTIYEKHI